MEILRCQQVHGPNSPMFRASPMVPRSWHQCTLTSELVSGNSLYMYSFVSLNPKASSLAISGDYPQNSQCRILTDTYPGLSLSLWADQYTHAPQEHPQPILPHHACNYYPYVIPHPLLNLRNKALQNAERASVRLAARFTAPIAGQPMFEVGALMHAPPGMFSAMLYQHPPPPQQQQLPQVQKRPSSEVEEPPTQKAKKAKKATKPTDGNGAVAHYFPSVFSLPR
jgi:hypothetical protein